MTAAHRPAATLWTLVVPGAIVALTVGVVLAWSADLPDPVASHWGSDRVDGFASLASVTALSVGVSAAVAVTLWLVATRMGQSAMTRRFAHGFAVGLTTFLCGVLLATLAPQRGLADAAQVGSIDAGLALAFVVAIGAGVLAAWLRTTSQRGAPWFVVGTVVFSALMGLVAGQWVLATVLALALGALLLIMLTWTVRVDREGLTAHAGLRSLRLRVPLDEVESTEVVHVDPLREFGGWGLRTGRDGRTGVVLRAGEALQVRRSGGRVVVVTVDDATTATALLNTLAARTR